MRRITRSFTVQEWRLLIAASFMGRRRLEQLDDIALVQRISQTLATDTGCFDAHGEPLPEAREYIVYSKEQITLGVVWAKSESDAELKAVSYWPDHRIGKCVS